MTSRSIAIPRAPTTNGARSIATPSGRCAYRVPASTVNAPTVKNSPWARFTIRIMPKMTASPRASSTRMVIELRTSSAMMTAVSRFTATARARRPAQHRSSPSSCRRLSDPGGRDAARARRWMGSLLWLVLRVLVRVFDQIAQLHGLGRRDIREALEDLPAVLVVHRRQMHGEDDVVTGRIHLDVTHRRVPLDPALHRLRHGLPVEAPRLLDPLGPEVPAVVALRPRVPDVVVRLAHLLFH